MAINILQIAVSVILITLVLLQERSSGLGGLFGGGGGMPYQSRRGAEKIIFGLTLASAAAFVLLAILNLVF